MEEETYESLPPLASAPLASREPLPAPIVPLGPAPLVPLAPRVPSALPAEPTASPTSLPLPSREPFREPYREPYRKDPVDHMKGETLVMANPGRIFPYIMPQESTHFQFKTKDMERRFQEMIEQIPDLTVRFDYGREDKSDILLVSSSDRTQIVGKLHLLLVDRRDRGDPSKRYVKIHLFHMKDPQQFELVRQRITEFFEKIGGPVSHKARRQVMTRKRNMIKRNSTTRMNKRAPIKHNAKRNNTKRNNAKRSMRSPRS